MKRIPPFISFIVFSALCYSQEITYSGHIEPLLRQKCISCHAPGEIGPMPLTTYEEVSSYGQMIRYVTQTGLMPPWKADPDYRHFKNERTLTGRELEQIRTWFQAGMPKGPAKEVPGDQTRINDIANDDPPDLVLSMAESFEQYGIYFDQYQVFVLPTGLEYGRYVRYAEFVPGNKEIVRRCQIGIVTDAAADSLDRWDPRYGYYSFGGFGIVPQENNWLTWTPHNPPDTQCFPKYLPAASSLLLHMHYGPTGSPMTDSSVVRIWFEEAIPGSVVRSLPLINSFNMTNGPFVIPANSVKRFHASLTLPDQLTVTAVNPQSHLLCTSWEVFATNPGKRDPVKLLKIPEWDFMWRDEYRLDVPVELSSGGQLHAIASYDNTTDNPYNPALPPIDMAWGRRMFEEMFLVNISFIQPVTEDHHPLHVYPVPSIISSGVLPVTFDSASEGLATLTVSHMDATEIMSFREKISPNNNGKWLLDIKDIDPGTYFLEVHSRGQLYSQQLFVVFHPDRTL